MGNSAASPTRALYELVVENVRSGTTPGERLDPPVRYEIRSRETTIGRAPECTIRLDDMFVSRRHARLVLRDVALHLEDLASTNQSRVNGAPAPTRVRIHPGDVLLFGGARCRIESTGEVEAADRGTAPPAPDEGREPEVPARGEEDTGVFAEAAGTGELTGETTGEEAAPWPPAAPPALHVAGPLPGEPRRTRLRFLAVVVVALAVVAAALFLRLP